MDMITVLRADELDFAQRFAALIGDRRAAGDAAARTAAEIIARVRQDGDAALAEYTERFDGVRFAEHPLRVTDTELNAAADAAPAATVAALERAARRIEDFYTRVKPQDVRYTDAAGVQLGLRYTPIDAAGLYVPGGTAGYPSSVLMNAVPARVAGVARSVATVPTPGGYLNPAVAAALRLAGVTEVYRIGGAQAIAALAYGTRSIAPVDKIVGPGNAYVAAAKRAVAGDVGIDSVAGPSEVAIIADAGADPRALAYDLCAQAEHDPQAQALLFTSSPEPAAAVATALQTLVPELPRAEIIRRSLSTHGAIIIADDDTVAACINRIAPEHLQLCVADPEAWLPRIRHAGAIFLGYQTPEAIGDYVAGPDHVLPTCGAARFSGGLGVGDFLKHTTMIGCDAAALRRIGGDAVTLARAEGLDAHAESVAERLRKLSHV